MRPRSLCAACIAAVIGAALLIAPALGGTVARAPVRAQAPGAGVFWSGTPSLSFQAGRTLPGSAPLLSPSLAGLAAAPSPPVPIAPLQVQLAAPAVPETPGERSLAVLQDWRSRAGNEAVPEPSALSSLWDGTLPGVPFVEDTVAPGGTSAGEPLASPAERLGSERESGTAETVPGSIFDFRPAGDSPNHGFPLLDRLIRWAMTRESRRAFPGFTLTNAAGPGQASVFLYGESHGDRALIGENMRRLASHLKPGRNAVVLDEAYFGPMLFGPDALDYLEKKGLDPDWLGRRALLPDLKVAGWDDLIAYQESSRPMRRHQLALLDLNHHLYGGERGLRYYAGVARRAWECFLLWLDMRRLAVGRRNAVLDAAVRNAAAEAAVLGGTVHVIAGAEHLVEKPWWLAAPPGRVKVRKSLVRALGAAPYWAGMP